MNPFLFHVAPKIYFGEDVALQIPDILGELGSTNPILITDANLIQAGVLDSVFAAFEYQGKKRPPVYDQVPPDSDVVSVEGATALARKEGSDGLIAVGGGSVIDTAKAVNICLTYGGNLLDYQGLNNLPSKLLPLAAVPTTAGTGSEVSLVAMVADKAEGKKLLFGSEYLGPSAAILDPKLLISLPPHLTAATGIDALTHAIEAYVCLATVSPITDALCLESMLILFKYLERATICGTDIEARSQTLVASTMAGLAFTNAGVGIVHALAHSTGARFNTHHGMTNAVFLPHGMEFNLDQTKDRYAAAARELGISQASDDTEAAKALIQAVRNLILAVKLPTTLKELGVPPFRNGDLEELALLTSTDAAIMFNPKESSLEDIVRIYERAY